MKPMLALTLALGLASLGVEQARAQNAPDAATLFYNGRIYTSDPQHTIAPAMVVRGDRIVFVGDEQTARKQAGPDAASRDLAGHLVLPGLVDSHLHPEGVIEYPACSLDSRALSLAQIADEVRACIARRKVPAGEWVLVDLWNFSEGMQTDPAHPTIRAALDRASTDHPIKLFGLDGHHYGFNSKALAMASLRGKDPLPLTGASLGDRYRRYAPYVGVDSKGEPDGYVTESAGRLFPAPGSIGPDPANLGDAPARIGKLLASRGIIAIQDGGGSPTNYALFDRLQAEGGLNLHVRFAQHYDFDDFEDETGRIDFDRMMLHADQVRQRYASNPLIRADAVKLYADGVLEGNPLANPPTLPNAPMKKPFLQPLFGKDAQGRLAVLGYVDTAGALCRKVRRDYDQVLRDAVRFQSENGFHPAQCRIDSGTFAHPYDQLLEFARRFHRQGYTLHIHAIGDRGVEAAVDAIVAARKSDGIASQPDAIAHLQIIAPRDIRRIGKAGIYTAFTFAWANALKDYDLTVMPFIDRVKGNGDDQFYNRRNYTYRQSYPARSVLKAGGVIVGGSDAPVETRDPRPFYNIQYAMTRQHPGLIRFNPAEALSLGEVLDAYTINGARGLGLGDRIGSLEAGKDADFIIVDRDIVKLAESADGIQTIRDTRVLETWFNGKPVFSQAP